MRLKPTSFSESFAANISVALGSDCDFIRGQVDAGVCQAWEFHVSDVVVGYAVTRLEIDTLVVVAYEGKQVDIFSDLMFRTAKEKHLPWCRIHTQRRGLIKMLSRFNPEPLEYIVRIKCYGR